MAKYDINQIKHDVRVVLGENESIAPLLNESDDIAIENDEIMESMILTAIDKVNSIAPLEMLTEVVESIDTTSAVSVDKYGGYGKVELDSDFLRFVSFQSSDWDVPVFELTDEKGDEYLMLHSRFEGIRASNERPAVVVRKGSSALTLEYYPSTDGESLYGLYIPSAVKDGLGTDNKVNIADLTYKAVIYLIANLYLVSIKETDFAATLASECLDLLGLSNAQAAQ